MALFRKNGTDAEASPAPSAPADRINMVGQGAVLEGTLRAEGDVRISGRVVGDLYVEGRAILAPEGVVDGTLSATHADVGGRVEGEIRVEERLVLKSTARIEGTISAGRIVVEEGALFSGECTMNRAAAAAEAVEENDSSYEEPAGREEEGAGSNAAPDAQLRS